MASAYTKPGTLRAGFDYQDIVAVDKIVDLIRHQCAERYQWIRIEADENDYLDDIQTLKGNGSFEFIQVKFSTDPDSIKDPWDWTDLLKRNKSKKSGKLAQSLLMKWATSVKDLNNKYSEFDAQLVTNRRASHELEDAFFKPGLVDIQRIQNPKLRQTIIGQLGDEETAKQFFLKFHFKFDQPSLEDMENHARQKFEEIGGTEDGWNSLKEHVRKWATERNQPLLDGLITLEWAKRAARWRKLETLPQEFGIPSDFVIPCQNFHESFLAEIKNTGGQCFVLAGSPGIGKSTYLSHLVRPGSCLSGGCWGTQLSKSKP
ncbi:MAG: dsDNA nuclease domain-containing protein [Lentisphaerae bacterium]|nr:dsDNA nuclease domain-containing protein [Lentisphaerota bacterium]